MNKKGDKGSPCRKFDGVLEEVLNLSIDDEGKSGFGRTSIHQSPPSCPNLIESNGKAQEVALHSIISFFKVQFNDNPCLFLVINFRFKTFGNKPSVDGFAPHGSTLISFFNSLHNRLESRSKNFRLNLLEILVID